MKLSDLDLNLLIPLEALLRQRNVTRAAREVGLSQPATSVALSRLRRAFDDELLVRDGRTYHLTPYASDLLPAVQVALATLERSVEHPGAFDPGRLHREFTIALSDYVLLVSMQPVIERLRHDAPGVKLRFRGLEPNTVRMMQARRIDLVIKPQGSVPLHPCEELFTDRWVCAIWRGNTEVGNRITRKHLTELPRLCFSVDSAASMAERHLEQLGLLGDVHVTAENFTLMPFLLQGSQMIALLPQRLAARLDPAVDIRILPSPVPIPTLVEYLLWNSLDSPDPAHTWLREVVQKAASFL